MDGTITIAVRDSTQGMIKDEVRDLYAQGGLYVGFITSDLRGGVGVVFHSFTIVIGVNDHRFFLNQGDISGTFNGLYVDYVGDSIIVGVTMGRVTQQGGI